MKGWLFHLTTANKSLEWAKICSSVADEQMQAIKPSHMTVLLFCSFCQIIVTLLSSTHSSHKHEPLINTTMCITSTITGLKHLFSNLAAFFNEQTFSTCLLAPGKSSLTDRQWRKTCRDLSTCPISCSTIAFLNKACKNRNVVSLLRITLTPHINPEAQSHGEQTTASLWCVGIPLQLPLWDAAYKKKSGNKRQFKNNKCEHALWFVI